MDRGNRRGLPIAVLGFALAAAVARPARAGSLLTTLDTFVPGGANSAGIDFGGQHYSGFGFINESDFALDPSEVTVHFSNGDGLPLFETVQFVFDVDAAAGQAGIVAIGYRSDVRSNSPYSRYGVRFNGTVPAEGPGAGEVSVSAIIRTVNGHDITPGDPVSDMANLFIHNDGPFRGEDDNGEFLQLSPTSSLYVSKQITLTAREAGPLRVSVVDLYQAIPEPSAGLLAVPAAAVVLANRRRRRPARSAA